MRRLFAVGVRRDGVDTLEGYHRVAYARVVAQQRTGQEAHAEVLDVCGRELSLRVRALAGDGGAEGAYLRQGDVFAVADGVYELFLDAGDDGKDVCTRTGVLLHDVFHELRFRHFAVLDVGVVLHALVLGGLAGDYFVGNHCCFSF